MANENLTEAYLINVPLENDYKNTLYFTSKDKQVEYFKSRKVFYFNDFSYQRKDEPVRIPKTDSRGLFCKYDDLINMGVNYVMYRNTTYSTKWFYAFITDIKYISEGITEIYMETDVMQTWLFDFNVKSSFVEREHVSDDTIGKHTVPESVETGSYINCYAPTEANYSDDTYICIATTSDIDSEEGSRRATMYNGIYSGLIYLLFDGVLAANGFLVKMDGAGKGDAIQSVFLVPKSMCGELEWEDIPGWEEWGLKYANVRNGTGAMEMADCSFVKPTTIGAENFSPKNKKLYTYPYRYLLASNNAGTDVIYKYEDFKEDIIDFKIAGSIAPGCSIKIAPLNYKGIETPNYEEGFNGAKLPICAWTTDVYINWLTQNGVNIAMQGVSSIAQIIGGVGLMATGAGAMAGAGAIAQGGMGIASAVGQIYEHSLIPPQARGNLNSSDVMYSLKKIDAIFYHMSIKDEYAKIIDDYFHMFGYKVNRVKIPNKAHRSRFWYTKTIDVNIDGAIPNKDMQLIKDCYNRGITFWRNAAEIQNYALDNEISITDGAVTE